MSIPTLIFVTFKGDKKVINPTKIFVTYKKSDVIHASIIADTSVKKANQVTAGFDTTRTPIQKAAVNADAKRKLANSYSLDSDSRRITRTINSALFDTVRQITGSVIKAALQADTNRAVIRIDTANYDTVRGVNAVYGLTNDTSRNITISADLLADTTRQVSGTTYKASISVDTILTIIRTEELQADTTRETRASESGIFDTRRQVRKQDEINADTLRELKNNCNGDYDTVRDIPYTSTALNPQSISINLEKGQLSEAFEMVTPYDLALEATITGKLLDFDYKFKVYESAGTGLLRTITGMYDVDKLLYTPFTYTLSTGRHSAKDHAKNIARMLGKTLYWAADDFISSETFSGIGGATIQNMISGLFGWAGNLPQDWINVFIRGDTLKIVQRGHEPNEIDITGTAHSRPEVTRRLMRSVWSGTGTHSARNKLTISPLGFSGTIRFGDSKVTYRFGLVVREVTATAQGQSVTTYDYDYDDYLVKKVTTSPDEVITTTYDYAITINDKYLATETAVSSDKSGNTNSTTVTQHVYLGNGWYGTAVYVDGAFQSSSVSSGKPGGKANKYIIDQSNLNLGSGYPKDDGGQIEGAALFDTEFPIYDSDTLKKLTRDIEWLNRRTEEKITIDIWQYNHLIDFTDKIIYNGNTYYLESNQVQRTPTELKQTVSIIRWY